MSQSIQQMLQGAINDKVLVVHTSLGRVNTELCHSTHKCLVETKTFRSYFRRVRVKLGQTFSVVLRFPHSLHYTVGMLFAATALSASCTENPSNVDYILDNLILNILYI